MKQKRRNQRRKYINGKERERVKKIKCVMSIEDGRKILREEEEGKIRSLDEMLDPNPTIDYTGQGPAERGIYRNIKPTRRRSVTSFFWGADFSILIVSLLCAIGCCDSWVV